MGPHRYEWLDAAVVIIALLIVGLIAVVLMFHTVPPDQLAVVSSLASGLLGTILGAYAGYRWATSKQASDTIADLARSGTSTMAETVKVDGDTVNVSKKGGA